MVLAQEGNCIQWSDCMPTRFSTIWRGKNIRQRQTEFVDKHNCFVSCGRVYVKLEKYIVDAVTGTLYWLNGHCVASEAALFVDTHDANFDKQDILKFVLGKY